MSGSDYILEVENFSGGFVSQGGINPILHNISYRLRRNTLTAVVGETGSGKSLTSLATMGLSPAAFRRTSGSIRFNGHDVTMMAPAALRRLRGRQISMVFQDARGALNPVFSVGQQLADAWILHHGGSRTEAMEYAIEALAAVKIPEPARRAKQYPHQFSGGMAQRVMIALSALICQPELLIMDEPTTGLDVTTQSDIMDLILDLSAIRKLSVCLITHDLGVVAETCSEVIIMRAGRVVETGSTEAIFTDPSADYTRQLLAASQLLEGAA